MEKIGEGVPVDEDPYKILIIWGIPYLWKLLRCTMIPSFQGSTGV